MKPYVRVYSTDKITRSKIKHNIKKCSFLVADPSEINRKIISKMLTSLGHNVTSVNNGQKIIDLASQNTFDIIWLDIDLPKIDGITVSSMLREKYNYTLPIIAITCYGDSATKKKCINSGINEMLLKPILPIMLEEYINFYCGKSKSITDVSHYLTQLSDAYNKY